MSAAEVAWLLILVYSAATFSGVEASTWCVVRSDASEQALQTALDYACGAGADCAPIQSSGLCYLPNTLQAHASYAFNSYYQRSANASGSCSFAGTATIATTDPSLYFLSSFLRLRILCLSIASKQCPWRDGFTRWRYKHSSYNADYNRTTTTTRTHSTLVWRHGTHNPRFTHV